MTEHHAKLVHHIPEPKEETQCALLTNANLIKLQPGQELAPTAMLERKRLTNTHALSLEYRD